eukprot:scaffold45649_cov55-Cyclotella_meneghiniana.AAC.4
MSIHASVAVVRMAMGHSDSTTRIPPCRSSGQTLFGLCRHQLISTRRLQRLREILFTGTGIVVMVG